MKKITSLLVSLFLIQTFCFAQTLSKDFTVTNSTPYAVIDAGSKEYLSMGNGTVILAKMRGGVVTLQKFDANGMKEVARNTYSDLPERAYFQEMVKLGSRVFYIYEALDKAAGVFSVYAREINATDGTFMKQEVLLTTSCLVANPEYTGDLRKDDGGFGMLMAGNKFTISKSFDESKVLISYRCVPKEKIDAKNYDLIGFYVFDGGMQKVWGKEVTMPYTEKDMNNVGYAVGANGEAKMIITNNVKKTYEVLCVNTSGVLSVKELGVSAETLVRNLSIKESKNGNFTCGGYYANGIEFTYNPINGGTFIFNANGLLLIQFDKNAKLLSHKNYEFPLELIQQNLSNYQKAAAEKREEKGKAGILDLFLTDFSIKEDGSAFFVGESEYKKYEFYGPSQTDVYHFANVIIIKVNADGSLAWMKKLAKNQAGVKGCGQMSISYLEGKNADYIAFVDNPKNIELSPEGGVPAAHKDGAGGFLTTYKIDHATGALEKHTICDLNNINGVAAYQFKTTRIFKSTEGEFLLEVYIKGKKDMMVKFKLN